MDDHLAILYLIPYSPLAYSQAKAPENARWLRTVELEGCNVPGAEEEPSNRQTSDAEDNKNTVTREGTPAAGGGGKGADIALRLGFDDLRHANGFVFGRASDSDILLPEAKSEEPENRDADCISRHHFRIHFNLASGVLMISDTSTFGTIVGNVRLRHDSLALTEVAIHCGRNNSIGFLVQIQDYAGYETVYKENLEIYASRFGRKPGAYLATPGATPCHRPISKDYHILDEAVAEGTWGSVHTVCRTKDGCLFAAKEIKCQRKKGRPTVPSEVDIMARLSHPGIVKYVDTVKWKAKVFVVMEYMAMGDLNRYLESLPSRRIHAEGVAAITRQLLEAVSYLTQENVIHRDIKPDNIMVVNQDPVVKLADFGLSTGSLKAISFCGTNEYAAPEVYEVARGFRTSYDERVDVWSLGVVALELLEGLPKCNGSQERYYQRIQAMLSNPRKQPFYRLIRRMLSTDPIHRPSASDCLTNLWQADWRSNSHQDRVCKRHEPPPMVRRKAPVAWKDVPKPAPVIGPAKDEGFDYGALLRILVKPTPPRHSLRTSRKKQLSNKPHNAVKSDEEHELRWNGSVKAAGGLEVIR